MGTFGKFVVLALLVCAIGAIGVGGCWSSVYNKQISNKNSLITQEDVTKTVLTSLWNILREKTGITTESAEQQLKYISALQEGRKGGSLAKFNAETNQNLDLSLFQDLSRATESLFKDLEASQKKALDFRREFRNLKDGFFSRFVVSGIEEPKLTLVLSGETQEAFQTGTLKPLDLMKKPATNGG